MFVTAARHIQKVPSGGTCQQQGLLDISGTFPGFAGHIKGSAGCLMQMTCQSCWEFISFMVWHACTMGTQLWCLVTLECMYIGAKGWLQVNMAFVEANITGETSNRIQSQG